MQCIRYTLTMYKYISGIKWHVASGHCMSYICDGLDLFFIRRAQPKLCWPNSHTEWRSKCVCVWELVNKVGPENDYIRPAEPGIVQLMPLSFIISHVCDKSRVYFYSYI